MENYGILPNSICEHKKISALKKTLLHIHIIAEVVRNGSATLNEMSFFWPRKKKDSWNYGMQLENPCDN